MRAIGQLSQQTAKCVMLQSIVVPAANPPSLTNTHITTPTTTTITTNTMVLSCPF